ncbi:MAG TPA: tetratricopeptide repeat protein [Gemmatimonadetes bacterium]|nr:tetratricopeptide repeat protein [Gemmatimonadota bacterium]
MCAGAPSRPDGSRAASPLRHGPRRAGAQASDDLGRLEEAAQACKRTLDFDPASVAALNNLGNTLLALGRPDEAKARVRAGPRPRAGQPQRHLGSHLSPGEHPGRIRARRTAGPRTRPREAGLGARYHGSHLGSDLSARSWAPCF